MKKNSKYKKQEESLLRVSAFYKNDTPNGIGIVIENTNLDLEEYIYKYLINYEQAWEDADDAQRDIFIKAYFDQLNYIAKVRSEDRDPEHKFLCVINIMFLEKYGFLKADNFNGCELVYGNAAPFV